MHKLEVSETKLTLERAVGQYDIEPKLRKFDSVIPSGYAMKK